MAAVGALELSSTIGALVIDNTVFDLATRHLPSATQGISMGTRGARPALRARRGPDATRAVVVAQRTQSGPP